MDNYNGFPATYQPVYQPYYMPQTQVQPAYWQYNNQRNQAQQPQAQTAYQQQQQPTQMNNSMVWVQGEAGAKAYVLPNNTTLPLWDSEAQVIYIKSVDASGKPSMTILDYVDRNAPVQEETKPEYVTMEQFDSLNNNYSSIAGQINDLNGHIQDLENKISSINKPQQNYRKGNNK